MKDVDEVVENAFGALLGLAMVALVLLALCAGECHAQTFEIHGCTPPACTVRIIIRQAGQPDQIYPPRGDGYVVVPRPPGDLVITMEGNDLVVTVK